MTSCVFPGSFDPVTAGHMNLIARAAGLFDRVTVALMVNIRKSGAIPAEKRLTLLEKACAGYPNVQVVRWSGLLADFMRENGERIVIRGVRSAFEFDQEWASCHANRMLNDQFETLFLPAEPGMGGVSSSAVREIAAFGGEIENFVPKGLAEEIRALLSK